MGGKKIETETKKQENSPAVIARPPKAAEANWKQRKYAGNSQCIFHAKVQRNANPRRPCWNETAITV
jgi:hypothetical protein